MAKIFDIALLNPIRFIPQESSYNPSLYWNRHFDDAFSTDLIKTYQTKVQYYQKYTTLDRPKIQVLSDYTEITAALFNCDGEKVYDISINEVEANIKDQTFLIYEIPVYFDFEGEFYLRIGYTNDDDEEVFYFSEPINIKEVQEGTVRFDYKNSINDFSVIFETGWEGIIRVEADIIDFKPGSVDTVYIDEVHDATLVNSTPFRNFSLAIGGKQLTGHGGVPDYIVDKINRVLSCDQVRIDGKYFCKSDGAQFEEFRSENYPFTAQRINISETENKFQYQFDTSFLTEEMINIYKVLKYVNNTSDIEINNKLKRFTCLDKIVVHNTGAPFYMTIRTESEGDTDDFIITELIDKPEVLIDINQPFSLDKKILLTGLNDNTTNIFVVYQSLDASALGASNPYGAIGVGAVVIYEEQNVGDFENDFDLITGLGKSEAWDKFAICDGRNGTSDRRDRFPLGNDGITDQTLKPVGQTGGSLLKRILKTHLPKINFFTHYQHTSEVSYEALDSTSPAVAQGGLSGWDQYRIGRMNGFTANVGLTNTIGGPNGDGTGTPVDNFDITPPFIRSIFVKKIQE